MSNMKAMVDFATIVSFLVAPILGYLNLRVVNMEHVPKYARPKKILIVLSWIGLFFLTAFGIYYIVNIIL